MLPFLKSIKKEIVGTVHEERDKMKTRIITAIVGLLLLFGTMLLFETPVFNLNGRAAESGGG